MVEQSNNNDNRSSGGGGFSQVTPILQAAQQHLRGTTTTGVTHSQRGRPRGGAPSTSRRSAAPITNSSSSSGMMRFVEGVMSPFVQCWQPPLNGCAGMELHMPSSSTTYNNYSCGDVATCADDMPVCGSGTATTSRPAGPVQTTSTMVTPMASSSTAPNHHHQQQQQHQHGTKHIRELSPAPRTAGTAYHPTAHSSQPQQQQRILTGIEYPTSTDVLCGRGGSSNRHNVHFRELVAANKAVYATLTKKQKMLLSRQVVETIHQAGGRFLAKDSTSTTTSSGGGGGRWNDIGLPRSLEKASQALREKSTTSAGAGEGDTEMLEASEHVHPETCTSTSGSKPKVVINPRLVVAEGPPLTIPPQLKHIYRSVGHNIHTMSATETRTITPQNTNSNNNPGWVAEFPPAENPGWVANFSPVPDPNQTAYGYHPSQQQHQSFHPSDRTHPMPAPHRGAYPFSSRQMSRMSRQSSNSSSHSVYPAAPSRNMVSPVPHHQHQATMSSWHPSPTPSYSPASASASATPRASWEAPLPTRHHHHTGRHPASPDPGYGSSGTSSYNSARTATHTLPELHQYSHRDVQQRPKGSIPDVTTTSHHPHPADRGLSPELKRQRTKDEGDNNEEETRDEEDVILFDESPNTTAKPFSLQDTSLTEGSQQLPAEVESKLSMQDKVISPSGMLQVRSLRPRGYGSASKRLNTSAEEEGLAGLAALSTAAFLRLDESC